MTLAASKGTEIKVNCVGKNSEKDLQNLINLVKNNFGEEKPLSENLNKENSLQRYRCVRWLRNWKLFN